MANLTPSFLHLSVLPRPQSRQTQQFAPRCALPRISTGPALPPDDALVDDTTSASYLYALEHNEILAPGCAPTRRSGTGAQELVDDATLPDVYLSDPAGVELARARSARRRQETRRVPPVSAASFSPRSSVGALSTDDEDEDPNALRAPNGLPEHGGPDLLQELLPILAREEQEATRTVSPEEAEAREALQIAYDQLSSMHRSGDRLGNLRPFQLRDEGVSDCLTCDGDGMVVCSYCKGDGFVDLGEGGKDFTGFIDGMEVELPKHVMGTTFHCPLCGGLRKERCVKCLGTGTLRERKKPAGAASEEDFHAWKAFDLEKLLEKEADRIEIGLDGAIILRARRRKRKSRKVDEKEKKSKDEGREHSDVTVAKGKGKGKPKTRGSRKAGDAIKEDGSNSTDESVVAPRVMFPRARSVARSTDFVHTTDYKVGRHLQKVNNTAAEQEAFSLLDEEVGDADSENQVG